jgi:hypothetical protein
MARSSSWNVVLAFPAHDHVGPALLIVVRIGRQAGVVPTDHDGGLRPQAAQQSDQTVRASALERHHRQTYDVGRQARGQVGDRLDHATLDENEVGDGDVVMRVDVAGQRGERAVRHAHGNGRHVLERVRHREQQNLHSPFIQAPGSARRV